MSEVVVLAISAVGFLAVGFCFSWLISRSKASSAFSAGQSAAAATLAIAEERVRSYERDLANAQLQETKLAAMVEQGRQEIEQLRADKAQYQERASRIPLAEAKIEELGARLHQLQTDLQAVGEQRVALETEAGRLPALEARLTEADAAKQADQQQLADQREVVRVKMARVHSPMW